MILQVSKELLVLKMVRILHLTDRLQTILWLVSMAHPAIPGFERAKYMVSFQDSVAVYGQDKPYADVAGGYTRVGFVEGIRVADTLWILPAQYRSVANDKVNFATLQAYNDSVVAKGLPAIKNLLTEDVHKNYVWSFRYVHPEKANNVTEEGPENSFLFESNIWPNSALPLMNLSLLQKKLHG